MTPSEFLELVHGPTTTVHFRSIGPSGAKNIFGSFEAVRDQLKSRNAAGEDIYFVVNSGGTKDKDISKINAVWLDIDAGEDDSRMYKPLEVVAQFKAERMQVLSQFALPPSFIVETRNGLHVYWLLEPGTTIQQFRRLMAAISAKFGGDASVDSPSNLMRVPGFNWIKRAKGIHDEFEVKVINDAGTRYSAAAIETSLGMLPLPEFKDDSQVDATEEQGYGTNDNQRSKSEVLIIDRPETLSQSQPSLALSWTEAIEFLKNQDPRQVLGISEGRLRCPFHDDHVPSLSVWKDEKTGHYLLKCHAQSCLLGVVDLLDYQRRLYGTTHRQAMMQLLSNYGASLKPEPWMEQEWERLQRNREFIQVLDVTNTLYPRLRARISWYRELLDCMHREALNNLHTPLQILASGEVVFFASMRHLAPRASKSESVIAKRLALLAALGLIRKLPDSDIPDQLLRTAEEHRKVNRRARRTAYYSIPTYSSQLFVEAEWRAIEFANKGMTIRGMCREMLAKGSGEDEARTVFPQVAEVSRDSNGWDESQAAMTALLNAQGYCTQSQVLDRLGWTTEVAKTRFKQLLPGLLKALDLGRMQSNAALKQRFTISSKGYPILFLRPKDVPVSEVVLDKNTCCESQAEAGPSPATASL